MLTDLQIFNAAWTAIKVVLGWFGIAIGSDKPKPDENTQAVEVANKSGRLSADQARETRADTQKELSANDLQTDAGVARVRDAGSVSDENAAVRDELARARARAHDDS
ncbi:hypothetical protein [Robbsia sp. KACC 23696]|uniref:hypothetical protein n=1 Tax=Robbsia sp. KACC 23696 TaxID=3149231 RepID=UPI00325AAEDC